MVKGRIKPKWDEAQMMIDSWLRFGFLMLSLPSPPRPQRGRGELSGEGGLRHLQQDPALLQREEHAGSAPDDGGVGHGRGVPASARRLPRQLPRVQSRHLQVSTSNTLQPTWVCCTVGVVC